MQVTVWSDVICPWAYLGRDRSALMADEFGCRLTRRAYELHPELPDTPRGIRPDGRYAAVLEQIGQMCAADGIEFRAPSHTANSHDALVAGEIVRDIEPQAHDTFEGLLFRAYFVDDRIPSAPDVVRDALSAVGIGPSALTVERLAAAETALDDSRRDAHEVGVTGTPSWLFPNGFVIPGAQSRHQTRRWVGRMVERSERAGDATADR